MSHDHSHASSNRTRLSIAIGIVALVLIAELVGSLLSGSLALFADAGHMFSDLLGLVIALVALGISTRPATDRQTFGFQRAEVFGALANGLILTGVAVVVAVQGVSRLFEPEPVLGGPMLIVAGVGLVANVVVMLMLRSGAKESIGMRGAYLEVLGDLFGSIAAIVAGVVILLTGFVQADAIASLVIAALIVPRALLLLRDVFRVLSQAVPANMDVAEIRQHLLATPGVVDVHEVHAWAMTSGHPVFSAHVVVSAELFERGGTGGLLDSLGECLTGHFDVEHSTIQLEPVGHEQHEGVAHR